MWWGHRNGGYPFCHAGECLRGSFAFWGADEMLGTSDSRLPKVDMNALYA